MPDTDDFQPIINPWHQAAMPDNDPSTPPLPMLSGPDKPKAEIPRWSLAMYILWIFSLTTHSIILVLMVFNVIKNVSNPYMILFTAFIVVPWLFLILAGRHNFKRDKTKTNDP
jgi:hypothetical protein